MPISQHDFTDAIKTFFSGLDGAIRVMVNSLESDLDLAYNAEELFPTTPIFKSNLIYELYSQAEEGKIDLAASVTLSHSNLVSGSGVLQDLDAGIPPTIRYLAIVMILVSNNWVTGMLYAGSGKEAPPA